MFGLHLGENTHTPSYTHTCTHTQVATTMLKAAHIEYEVTQNGKEAVDCVRAAYEDPMKRYDIVVSVFFPFFVFCACDVDG